MLASEALSPAATSRAAVRLHITTEEIFTIIQKNHCSMKAVESRYCPIRLQTVAIASTTIIQRSVTRSASCVNSRSARVAPFSVRTAQRIM